MVDVFKLVRHNPYFNRWFSAIRVKMNYEELTEVTILILIDGFLQSRRGGDTSIRYKCHNPYFNRWFSAILERKFIKNR